MKAPKDQHFLVDADAVALIADTVPISDRKVLEIGPGGGVLTDALLQRGALVRAVELDETLIPNLNRRFSEQIKSGQLEIIRGDASKVPLPETCRTQSPQKSPSGYWRSDLNQQY